MNKPFYSSRKFLNPEDSPSTGSVCCFDGITTYNEDKQFRNIFISVSDCHVKARLHKSDNDSVEDFIFKLETLNQEIANFIKHLKESKCLEQTVNNK